MTSSFDITAAAATARQQVATVVLQQRQAALAREQQQVPQHPFALHLATTLVTDAEQALQDVIREGQLQLART